MLDLESIFGDRATSPYPPAGDAHGAAPATDPDAPGPEPLAVPTAAAAGPAVDAPDLGPVDAQGDHGGDVQPQGQPPGDAPGNLAAELAWIDRATEANPCPRCGSLELWWDLLGQPHCQHCDARTFERGLRWIERAARLRRRYGKAPVPAA